MESSIAPVQRIGCAVVAGPPSCHGRRLGGVGKV